jgi:signal transduction histidine kinase/predicted outer membrane lipoprotein
VTVELRIRWVLGLVLALAFIVIAVWLSNTRAARDAEASVQHTLDVQNSLVRLLSAAQDTETSYRGFAITGMDPFLEPSIAAREATPRLLDDLGRLTADNPDQQRRLAALRPLTQRQLAFGDRVVATRRSAGFDAVHALIASGEGKRTMDAIRLAIAELRSAEDQLLAARKQSAAARTRAAVGFGAAAMILLVAAVGIFLSMARKDIADRARVTEALRQSDETLRSSLLQLERSNRDLQDFAMVASHDLQEPLRKIQMFGDRLRDAAGSSLSAEGQDYLRRMQAAADRGQVLIEGLLAYSRVTTKARPPAPVELETIAREVVGDLEARLAAVGGEVAIGPLPAIEADPLQMRQLLQNLVANALKFHRPDAPPRVRIEAEAVAAAPEGAADRDMWRLSVTDNGIGFEEKYLDRIFKLFQRLHERHVYDGAGMGLAICRRIAERHGGTITARSTPGQGSTFIVTLPARQAQMETSA